MIRSLLREFLSLPARIAHGKALEKLRRSKASTPVLSFGGVLDRAKLVHGGAVKLLTLRDAFASDEGVFNILYLVSSAPAVFPEDLVKQCRELNIRFVWNQNGVGYPGWAGRDAERHNAPMRRLRSEADFIIYQSAFCQECAERFLDPYEQRSEILFNPVDLERFRPAGNPLPPGPLQLLTLGTHNYADRVLSTIEALKVLRDAGIDAQLTIAGRLQWEKAEEHVRFAIARMDLGNEVRVRPAFTQDEAAELYRNHHILLHPKYLDPCPTVVIEALASGLPVVGSRSGGLPEMVPETCGKLIPVPLRWDKLITPHGGELAAAVQNILPRLPSYSLAARKHAEQTFSARHWVSRHAEIFRQLLS